MYDIALKDFRGFHDQEFVKIKPLTVLVGENSAGKSSFLSAVKYMGDLFGEKEDPSFNGNAFQLGTFQQITHYRGGRPGRAKEFHLLVRIYPSSDVNDNEDKTISCAIFNITFTSLDSHAAISRVEISSPECEVSIRLRLSDNRLSIEFVDKSGTAYSSKNLRRLGRFPRRAFSAYWRYFLIDMFHINSPLRQAENEEGEIPQDIVDSASTLIKGASKLSRVLSSEFHATSAIRTKPQRTYTPGTEVIDGEGSHVPFEIAKLSRGKNREDWNSIKAGLDKFGQSSEMFKEINIRSFGKSISDPFQIQIIIDTPKFNIVDMGYGTSQVLPIVYQIITSNKEATFLIQQPEVHLHPKAQAALGEFFVNNFIEKRSRFLIETHSDFIIDRIRNKIASKEISKDDVSILFFERIQLETRITQIQLDNKGRPESPPDTYREFFLGEQMRMLGI